MSHFEFSALPNDLLISTIMDSIPDELEPWLAMLNNDDLLIQIFSCFPCSVNCVRRVIGVNIATIISKLYSKRIKLLDEISN